VTAAAQDRAELSSYAAGRWPSLVRALVLLGCPPRHAPTLAAEAVSRLIDRCADDDWVDLDVVLAGELVAAWEDDGTPWWTRPGLCSDDDLDGTDLPDLLAALDRWTPAHRARAAVAATLGLTPDQLSAAVGPVEGPVPVLPAGVADPAAAVAALPVGEVRVAEAEARSVARRRADRGRTLVALVVALAATAMAVPLVATALDRAPAAPAERSAPPPTSREVEPPPVDPGVPVGRRPVLVPAPWYDGRRVHLADRTVRVPGVRAMSLAFDGVVATDRRGRVVHVRSGGATEVIGRTGPGSSALAGGDLAAWIDGRTVALQPLGAGGAGGGVRVEMPAGARVVAVDAGMVHVDSPRGALVLDGSGLVEDGGQPQVLDVAGEVVLSRQGLSLQVRSAVGGRELDGYDGLLSPGGTHALVRALASSSTAATRVLVVATGAEVVVPLPEGSVVDSSFGSDDQATFVVARPDASPYLADASPAPRDEYPGHDIVVCDLGTGLCRAVAQAPDSDAVPLLAR
jgi:hypothetical protein